MADCGRCGHPKDMFDGVLCKECEGQEARNRKGGEGGQIG